MKTEIKVGSIVKPKAVSGYVLRSGAGWYSYAIVVCMDPFILVSSHADMMWEHTIKLEDFEFVEEAHQSVLDGCMQRLKNATNNKTKNMETEEKVDSRNGVQIIADERRRQIEHEKWSEEHDDEHNDGQISNAAACYASPFDSRLCTDKGIPESWPWDDKWWKPTPGDRIRELAKAGALIAAEIDRLNRLNSTQ